MTIENFNQFYDEYQRFSAYVAYCITKDKLLAEDISQEIFITFYKMKENLDYSDRKKLKALVLHEAAAEESEREVLVPTAKDWGLALREVLFAKKPAAPTLELRRAAILALLQISGDGFTIESINRALSGCGIRAVVAETGQSGRVRVTFPNTAGIPEEFDQIAGIITDIIPCHLETELYFRYLTWVELEARFTSWESIEQGGYTWEQLELAV